MSRKRSRPGSQRGRGWLELAIIATAISVISWFWMAALLEVQAAGEKTILELTLRNMRTGLQLRVGELMLAQRVYEIPLLAGQNPVQWLAQPPERYLGELDTPPKNPPPRSWYFDRSTRVLVYLSGAANFAETAGKTGPLAWRIEPTGGRNSGLSGVRLVETP